MDIFNSYWPIYKNLEEETLRLSKYINFSDDQLNVYSMHIADLIIKIVIEIEDLSKKLYKEYGGQDIYSKNGKRKNLHFDTDCLDYLNTIWGICNRDILISCSDFNFTGNQLKSIKPLKNANKCGVNSSIWNIAYQALKHDRRSNLRKGNIKNLIYALGALYILNIYNRTDVEGVLTGTFDNRLGSSIFAVMYADATLVSISEQKNDNAIIKEQRDIIPISTCIIKYTKDSWKTMHEAVETFNQELFAKVTKDQRIINVTSKIDRADSNGNKLKQIDSLVHDVQIEHLRKEPPISVGRIIANEKKQVILNKNQNIYE